MNRAIRTPDDSTAIVRIMSDFSQFVNADQGPVNKKLSYEETETSNSSQAQKTHTNTLASSKTGKRQHSERDVEIFKNRSKIAYLENELNSAEKSQKRARVENDRDSEKHKRDLRDKEQELSELRKTVKYALDQEKLAKEQFGDLKKEFEGYKKKMDTKMQLLQREKLKFSSEVEEVRQESSQKILELQNTLAKGETQQLNLQSKLEEAEEMLEIFKRRYSQAVNNATELEEAKNKARTAEHRVKELEHQLSLQSEASSITVSFQNQLTKYRALEKENAKLKEDNQYYRQTNESNLLLKEETEHVKAKLSRAEQRLKDLIMLEVENEELKKKVQKYGVEDKFGSKRHSSPVGRVHEVSTIREVKTDDIEEILNELDKVKESDLRHQELAEGLQRHLFIVTADRDACRKILNQFDTKYSANCDPQLKHRLTETEMQLTSYEQHVEKQQVELQNAKEELSTVRLKVKELERALNGFKKTSPSQASESSPTLVTELKTQLEKLKKENGELAERLEVYELRKEQMHMQGYFDPLKTKVVHFSMNPSNLARQQRAEEIKRLQDENEALRQRVWLLEEGKASPGDQAAWKNLSPDAGDPSVMKQVQDVKAQLSSSELKNQRLKEVFSRKIQEFREACYALTGYKIDVVRDKKYRLQSMYAERANDDLLFESNSKGEMMMLQTDFSAQVADQIDTYLKKMNSIPAFLSAVTLDLFSRQTTTIVIN